MSDEFEIDMEESMRETYREIESEEPEESEEGRAERLRDERGRFVSTNEADGDTQESLEETEETQDDVDEPGEEGGDTETDGEGVDGIVVAEEATIAPVEEEEGASLTNPPPTLTAAAKAEWKNWPESAKREFLKREEDSIRGVESLKEQLSGQAEFGQKMREVVDPYMPIIQAEGGTPETAVQEMLNSAYILRQGHPGQKAQMALQLAQQYGFVNELVAMFQGNPQNVQHAPAYDPRVDQLEQQWQQHMQSQEEMQARAVQEQIQAFETAVDEDGSLAHPYYENVKGQMIALLETGEAQSLEEAYNAAIWMNPETREVLLREQTSQKEVERQEKAKERAKKAEKANKLNLPKRGHHDSKPAQPTGSIEDTMREAYANLNG